MRLVACLTMCLTAILANATQTHAQAPSDPQAYCVNRSADFYPYRGENPKRTLALSSPHPFRPAQSLRRHFMKALCMSANDPFRKSSGSESDRTFQNYDFFDDR